MAAPNPPLPPPHNQPLPPNTFHPDNETSSYDAYELCLENESRIDARDTTKLVHARCLGYLLRELPTDGRKVVAHEILECVRLFLTAGLVTVKRYARLITCTRYTTINPLITLTEFRLPSLGHTSCPLPRIAPGPLLPPERSSCHGC